MIKLNEEALQKEYCNTLDYLCSDKTLSDEEMLKTVENAAFLSSLSYLDKADESSLQSVRRHNAATAAYLFSCGGGYIEMDLERIKTNDIDKETITDMPAMYETMIGLYSRTVNISFQYGLKDEVNRYKTYVLSGYDRLAALAEKEPKKYGAVFFNSFDGLKVGDSLAIAFFMENDKIPTVDDLENMDISDYGPDFSKCKDRLDNFIKQNPGVIKDFLKSNPKIIPSEELDNLLD